MRNFVNLTTASAIAITSVMATVAPAAANTNLKSWEDRIAEAKAFEAKTGRKGGWTRGRHSNKAFKALSGVDGWMFGNILGDDDVIGAGEAWREHFRVVAVGWRGRGGGGRLGPG